MTSKSDEMKERKALAGSTSATTYFQQTQVAEELDANAGRFAKPSVVSGSTPAVKYPRLPSSSPWAADIVPVEPALGYSVHDLQPTGEVGEISASLDALEAPTSASPSDVVETGASIPLATSSPPVPASVSSLPSVGNDVAAPHIKRRRVVV
jgi:hypothetical protein